MLAQYQGQPEEGPAARETSEKVNLRYIQTIKTGEEIQVVKWRGGGIHEKVSRRPCVGICFLVKKKMAELGRL